MTVTKCESSLVDSDNQPLPDILGEGYPSVMTLEQTADALQTSVTGARLKCQKGQIPAYKFGNQWRIPKAWLIEHMRDSLIKGAS